MSDYEDIFRLMADADLRKGNIGGMHANSTGLPPTPENTLTREKLLAMMTVVDKTSPPVPGIDLHGHTHDPEACYILDKSKLFPVFDDGRRTVVVPEAKILEIYRVMREQGMDVRLRPRYGAPAPKLE